MNWKSILRFKAMGVVLALALMIIPVGYEAAADGGNHGGNHGVHDGWNHGGNHGVNIVDPVKTDAGYVSGMMIGDPGKEARIYKGIPYAAPPVGDLRWKPPQPVTPWEGILEATEYSPMAAQYPIPSIPLYGSVPESGMSEDCLYLNVVTPAIKKNERLPVMVYVHGGGITFGTSNRDSNNNQILPLHGVVAVSVQHRIGPIGYMAHPGLTAESTHHASGNYGQLDLIAALKWVKRNIAAFGGDPHNVTFWGHSGGGSKTLWLMASPLAKGLMNKAIVEAGCAVNSPFNAMSMSVSLADGENAGMSLGTLLNAPTIADLRNKTWQEIVRGANTPGSGFATNFTVDGWSLEDSLYNTFKAGQQNDIPFMIGAGEGEPLKHLGIQLWADALLTGKSNMYVYLFSHVPTGWRNQGLKAYHGLEVAYQFGGIDTIWFHYRNLFAPPAGLTPDPGIDEQDVWLTEAVMRMWVQFAETGDPSIKGLIKWPHFDLKAGKDRYLDIDVPLEVKSGYMDLFH